MNKDDGNAYICKHCMVIAYDKAYDKTDSKGQEGK